MVADMIKTPFRPESWNDVRRNSKRLRVITLATLIISIFIAFTYPITLGIDMRNTDIKTVSAFIITFNVLFVLCLSIEYVTLFTDVGKLFYCARCLLYSATLLLSSHELYAYFAYAHVANNAQSLPLSLGFMVSSVL